MGKSMLGPMTSYKCLIMYADDTVHISNGVTSDEAMRSKTLYNKFEGCDLIWSTVNRCRPYLKKTKHMMYL